MSSEDRMLKHFRYEHLPPELQVASRQFAELAEWICGNRYNGNEPTGIEPGPERTVALRKLLEAKDAAVRAVVHPGG